jgi:hypothetical protein
MLTYKAISAVAAAALGAAVIIALPGFSPQVEAGTPAPVVKSDRLDSPPVNLACAEQSWPYYQANCLRDRSQLTGQGRKVRLVTTDRLAP